MRILLFGKNGQVGWELQRALAPLGEVLAAGRAEADFTDLEGLRAFTLAAEPDLIVNAAAYTAVDRAESEPDLAMRVNGEAPGVLAEIAGKLGIGLVHYSTDYVFDGTKGEPYTEQDEPNPLNVYGASKLAGEQAIQALGRAHLILRTSWVFSLHGSNFLRTILRLARERETLRVVNDQVGCPTWCGSVAAVTAELLTKLAEEGTRETLVPRMAVQGGLYHACAGGSTSWFGFAQAILESDPGREQQIVREVFPIPSEAYPTAAQRPTFSVLATEKLKSQFGLEMPVWQEQLASCWRAAETVEGARG